MPRSSRGERALRRPHRPRRGDGAMKRIILVAVSTFAALVALFSYPTSTGQSGTTAAQPVSAAKIVTGAATPTPTTTGQGPDPASRAAQSTSASGSSAAAPTTSAAPT